MQTDMHYYGTYALARAAGIKSEHAGYIATASQYVDDSKGITVELPDSSFLDYRATAHGTSIAIPDIKDTAFNKDEDDQRYVWIPFHFLPACEGTTLAEKLICKIDSAVANEMVAHHLSLADQSYGALLMGVTAHVYADTFSHYGFSGVTSQMNDVDTKSIDLQIQSSNVLQYAKERASDFWEKCKGEGAEKLTLLGHGGAATFPDRPFLSWSFNYTDGRKSGLRPNHETFLNACEKLHNMFITLGDKFPGFSQGDGRGFQEIKETVSKILAVEGTMEERITAWQNAAQSGLLFGNQAGEQIPVYDSSKFENDAKQLSGMTSEKVKGTFVYVFMKAASVHRNYVLQELLPLHGVDVILP